MFDTHVGFVTTYNINEARKITLPALDQLRRIMLLPLLLLVTQVSRKRLSAPRALARVRNGGKRAYRLVLAWVLQKQRQRPVAAHGVAGDGDARSIQLLESGKHQLGQLLGHVRVHLVVGIKGCLEGVNVKGRGAAKIPRVVLAVEVEPARRGVGEEQGQAERRGIGVEETLLAAIIGGAGEAREEYEDRRRGRGGRSGWEEEV